MIRTAIVEDDPAYAAVITDFYRRYAEECGRAVKIDFFESGSAFLEGYGEGYDLVFLDIELPGLDGMHVAADLRARDKSVLIIFVTNLAQYAVNGYDVQAFDFIVKPIKYYNFAMKLRRAFECLDNLCKRKIWISTRQGKQFIINNEQNSVHQYVQDPAYRIG